MAQECNFRAETGVYREQKSLNQGVTPMLVVSTLVLSGYGDNGLSVGAGWIGQVEQR